MSRPVINGAATSSAEILKQYLGLIDAQDLDGVRLAVTPEAQTLAPGVELHGPDAIAGWVNVFNRAFPDLHHELRSVAEIGDTCWAEIRATGTHTGPLTAPGGDIPPTGKSFVLNYAEVARVEGGLVVSEHIYFDQLGFMQQLGLM